MPTFPSYAKLHKYPVKPESAVLRTEMESGPAKQAKIKSRVLVPRDMTCSLDSKADYLAFKTWIRIDIGQGSAWFDWADPEDGVTKPGRIVRGGVSYRALNGALTLWEASFQLETWDG